MNLKMIADFIAKSDLKKMSVACYFWTSLCYMLLQNTKDNVILPPVTFAQLGIIIIIAAFGGNVLTHYIRNQYPLKDGKEAEDVGSIDDPKVSVK
jgi:hypothetical protein